MVRSTDWRMLLATDFSDSALLAHDYAVPCSRWRSGRPWTSFMSPIVDQR